MPKLPESSSPTKLTTRSIRSYCVALSRWIGNVFIHAPPACFRAYNTDLREYRRIVRPGKLRSREGFRPAAKKLPRYPCVGPLHGRAVSDSAGACERAGQSDDPLGIALRFP